MGRGSSRSSLTKYKVLRAKHSNYDPSRIFWKEVGMLLMRENGSGGVLYLHWLDGDYLVKPLDDEHDDH